MSDLSEVVQVKNDYIGVKAIMLMFLVNSVAERDTETAERCFDIVGNGLQTIHGCRRDLFKTWVQKINPLIGSAIPVFDINVKQAWRVFLFVFKMN